MTGLNDEQLTDLVARLYELCGDKFVSAGPPLALGLFRSVALVVCLIRKNVTQDFAGAVFGVSQATVSRRWDLLRPLIGDALADVVPDPLEVVGRDRLGNSRCRAWRTQVQRSVWPLGVVVRGVCGQHPPKVPLAEDQHPVGQLGPHRQHEAFGEAVRPRLSG